MKISRNGSLPSHDGPGDWFTGAVRNEPVIKADAPARVQIANVSFQPGARTAWHIHPLGQTLIITSGVGWVQKEGGPVEEVFPGDVIWFPPNVKHWHGASATSAMSHLAVQEAFNGAAVQWMEHVADAQYQR